VTAFAGDADFAPGWDAIDRQDDRMPLALVSVPVPEIYRDTALA
jgi:hypothetical protein